MNIKDKITEFFNLDIRKDSSGITQLDAGQFFLNQRLDTITRQTAFMEYAVSMCINKIANALSQCKFDTYKKNEILKGDIWYKLNVSPNLNQNTTDFWNKLIYQAVMNQDGALIVQSYEGYLLIADSYSVEEKAVMENLYTNVTVSGFTFERIFMEHEVLRIKISNKNIKELINLVYKNYAELIDFSIKNYKRQNARKVFVRVGGLFNQYKTKKDPKTGKSEYDEKMDDLFRNRLKGYFSDKDSATPLEDGLEIDDKTKELNAGGKYRASDDIRSLLDDVINLCADAFNIPRGLFKGDTADVGQMTENFITFCINPIASQLEDEINRKLYGMDSVLAGNKLRIKTYSIKSYDPEKLANAAEALYRIGAVNPNWVRELLNEEEIGEDWANEYGMTKNYEQLEAKIERIVKAKVEKMINAKVEKTVKAEMEKIERR